MSPLLIVVLSLLMAGVAIRLLLPLAPRELVTEGQAVDDDTER